ncbi:hypothetical protein LCGC14_0359790 [marine sediment metagenome]|uniref:Uncharacterized protein n=1 Tax=marine sediment metagenome TaxID=412755 RepID=A0A0F9T891_9ZZZZ
MIIKLNTVLVDEKGEPLKDGDKEIVTLGVVCTNALLAPDPEERNLDNKVKKYHLHLRMFEKEEVEITADEIVLLEKCINVAYTQPLIVGQVRDILEQKVLEQKEEN